MNGCNSVLQESSIMVHFVLYNRAKGQNSFIVLLVVRQRISQKLECLVILAKSDVQKANGGKEVRVLRIGIQAIRVGLQSLLVV